MSLIFPMINVQTDLSTAETKETIVRTVAQSSSSKQKNSDTNSESSNSMELMPWLILLIVAFFVFGSINVLMKAKKHESGGNARGSAGNASGFGGVSVFGGGGVGGDGGGDCGGDGGC